LKVKNYLAKILYPVLILFLISGCILLLLNSFQYGHDSLSNTQIEINKNINSNNVIESCSIKNNNLNNLNVPYITDTYSLELIPKVSNFYCLGKVMSISFDQNTNKSIVYLGANSFIFNAINLILNLFLIILIFFRLLSDKFLMLIYLTFNYFNFYLFNASIPKIKILIPYINPENNYYSQIYFFNVLFLILYVAYSKNRYLQIAWLNILLFFIPDYLGIFILLLLVVDKSFSNQNSFNSYHKILFYITPIAFFVSRIIFSFHNIFDNLWLLTGQKSYSGLSRYYDAIWNFEAMSCIYNQNIFDKNPLKSCRELSGGVLDDYIYITTEPVVSSLYFTTLMLLLIVCIYLWILRTRKFNFIYVVLIFISPGVNFLTFQGNLDIFYWIFIYILLTKYPKQYLIISICLLLLSLYKIHALGAILGLLFHFIKIKDLKYTILNAFFLMFSAFFAAKELFSGSIIKGFGTVEYSYGLYFLSGYIGNLLTINSNLVLVLMIFLLLIFITYTFNKKGFIKSSISEVGIHYDVLLVWFIITLAIANNSYRLPIFTLLFLYFLKSDDDLLKYSTVVFLSLSVTPLLANYAGGLKIYNVLIYNFVFIKHLAFFVLTFSVSKLLLTDLVAIFRPKANLKHH
jgi:hypothetical protein